MEQFLLNIFGDLIIYDDEEDVLERIYENIADEFLYSCDKIGQRHIEGTIEDGPIDLYKIKPVKIDEKTIQSWAKRINKEMKNNKKLSENAEFQHFLKLYEKYKDRL